MLMIRVKCWEQEGQVGHVLTPTVGQAQRGQSLAGPVYCQCRYPDTPVWHRSNYIHSTIHQDIVGLLPSTIQLPSYAVTSEKQSCIRQMRAEHTNLTGITSISVPRGNQLRDAVGPFVSQTRGNDGYRCTVQEQSYYSKSIGTNQAEALQLVS